MRRFCLAVLMTTVVVAGPVACAKRAPSTGEATRDDVRPSKGPERGSDVINAAELADPAVASGDALAAVRRLRPRFLSSRGAVSITRSSAGTTMVSMNGGPLQGVGFLSSIRAAEILEIRYLSGPQAATRFGTTAGTGAVMLVKTR